MDEARRIAREELRKVLKEKLTEHFVQQMMESDESRENVEVPVGGRTNHGNTQSAALSSPSDPPTKTVEVPIQGGDVEDPETVEKEVVDPDLSEDDLTEGLSPDQMGRVNREERTIEDMNPEDVSVGGWRRNKEDNDE